MSNLTLLRLTKLQPVFHMVGSSYVDVAYAQNLIESGGSGSGNGGQNNHSSSDNFLLLLEENYSYRSTSTIVLMVAAWILLILGFVFCCCAECFGISVWRGKKRGGSIESGSTSAGSIAAGVAVTASSGVVRSDLHAGEFLLLLLLRLQFTRAFVPGMWHTLGRSLKIDRETLACCLTA